MAGVPKLDGSVVCVSWNDAHFNTDEVDGSDVVHRPWVYVSCGVLVKSNETGVTLTQDVGEDGKYRGRTFIPRAMIIDEWLVGPVKPKRKRKRKEKNAEIQQ